MKKLLTMLVLIPILSMGQKITQEQKIQNRIDAAIKLYSYPTDKRTNRISYEKTIDIPNTGKDKLFKRALQFKAIEDFGRPVNIRCKNNTNITTTLVSKDILIEDEEEGKLAGYGFIDLNWIIRNKYNYMMTFKYIINVKDNRYKYQFTDFRLLEFLSAPKEKSRSSGYSSYVGYGMSVGSRGGVTTFSDASVVTKEMEEMIITGIWQDEDAGHNEFVAKMKIIIGDLKETMKGNL